MIKEAWRSIWRTLLFVLLWALFYAPFVLVAGEALESGNLGSSWFSRLFFDAAGLLTILLAAWVMLRFVDRRPFVSLGFHPNRMLSESLVGIAVGVGMVMLTLLVLWIGGWARRSVEPEVQFGYLTIAVISMLLNASLQEVLCRSYIFQTIQSRHSARIAIVLTSALFVLLHAGAIGQSLMAAVNLFAAGVLLGLAYHLSQTLWLPIALHFAWNVSLGPLLGLSVSGQALDVGHQLLVVQGPDLWTGGTFGVEASLPATLATVIGIVVIYLRYVRPRRLS